MIHIENINITVNAQALSDEAETSHTLDVELLKAMVDSLFTKDEDAEEAKDAEPENQEEVQPPINAARMDSLQQQSEALRLASILKKYDLSTDYVIATEISMLLASIQTYGSWKYAEAKGRTSADLREVRAAWDEVYAGVQAIAALAAQTKQ